MSNSQKRVVLLTGAGGLLGRTFISRYRQEYEIVAVYRTNKPWFPSQDTYALDPLAPGEPVEDPDPIFTVRADLLDKGATTRVVEAALNRFDHIDLIVNAAMATTWAPMIGQNRLADSVAGQFQLATEVPLRLANSVAELSWKAQSAVNRELNRNIVNVSSIAGLNVYPGSGQSVYAAAKAALLHFTAHMAVEFEPLGVRVNATAANSYPQLVPVRRAVEAVHDLDQGTRTGTAIVVDGDENRSIALAGEVVATT